jgi:hypothetical protein
VNQPPIILPRHGVQIPLAQKALVVGFHKLVDIVGIAASLVIEELNCPGILHPAMNSFFFLVPSDGVRDLGRRNRQREQNQQGHKEHTEQQEPFLLRRSRARRVDFGAH